jgi:uncharacterized protein involved in outer membrane biogenesis
MTARAKRWGAALAAIAVLVAAFVAWFDWNLLKPYVERKVTEKTGREFHIRGNLDVRLSFNPLVTAEGLTLANAEWSQNQPMLAVERASFRINLWQLIRGHIELPEVTVSHPHVVLERRADGERNWILTPEEKRESTPPHIGHLRLDQGRLVFHDEAPKTHVTLDVSTESGANVGRLPTKFSAQGTLKDMKFSAQGRAGDVISLADRSTVFPLQGTARIGTTRLDVDGTVTGIATLEAMDAKLDLRGDDLSLLYPIFGIVLIPSPAYRLSGRLVHSGTQWDFSDFAGKVGDSDLSGDFKVNTGGKRPKVVANLTSKVLDMRDLGGFIGAKKGAKPEEGRAEQARKAASTAAQRDRLLPDREFRLDRLRAMDADVKFLGQTIRNKDLPFEKVDAHVTVEDGRMTFDPLNFGVAGGTVASTIVIDGRNDVPAGSAKVDARRLQLRKLLPTVDFTKTSVGTIGGRMDLRGHGKSVGALLASADGRLAFAMSSGEISNQLLEIVGLDGGEIMKFLFRGDQNVPLRCAVADFEVKRGIMSADTFVIDTTDTIVLGEGGVSLVDETIELTFKPYPKDASIFSLRSPIHLTGTLKNPKVRPDKALYARIGAAVLLGALVNPLAAILPTIETGPGEDANCGALLASVRQAAAASKGGNTPTKNSSPSARR